MLTEFLSRSVCRGDDDVPGAEPVGCPVALAPGRDSFVILLKVALKITISDETKPNI